MRQIWVVSDDKSVAEQLTTALSFDVYGVRYVVSQTDAISKIPERDLRDPGVVFLVDAFHSPTAGFTGARDLRARGFTGHIFLCGEPALEEAVQPFAAGEISGFMPPIHRLDYTFTAGMIHSSLNFSQELRLSHFLGKGGRASTETISTINDFNQLTLKLINFVSRFGVDIQKVKKVLVSVAYSHIQSGPAGVQIPKPFKLSFGLDPKKIIISTSLELDPEKESAVKDDFCTSLKDHRGTTSSAGRAIRPDFMNASKLTENFSLIWGEAQGADEWKKSTYGYLLVAIPFNFQTAKGERPYFFSYVRVKATAEKDETLVDQSVPLETSMDDSVVLEAVPGEVAPDSMLTDLEGVEARPNPEDSIVAETNLSDEPAITGDVPRSLDLPNPEADFRTMVSEGPPSEGGGVLDVPPIEAPEASEVSELEAAAELSAGSAQTSEEYQALVDKFEALQKEMLEQKVLNRSLAEDVKRLMKERRQPISTGELKELNEEMKGKAERLQAQNKALSDEVIAKETRMKELEEQVKRLKVAA